MLNDEEKQEVQEWWKDNRGFYTLAEEEEFIVMVNDCAAELAMPSEDVYSWLEELLEEEE